MPSRVRAYRNCSWRGRAQADPHASEHPVTQTNDVAQQDVTQDVRPRHEGKGEGEGDVEGAGEARYAGPSQHRCPPAGLQGDARLVQG